MKFYIKDFYPSIKERLLKMLYIWLQNHTNNETRKKNDETSSILYKQEEVWIKKDNKDEN